MGYTNLKDILSGVEVKEIRGDVGINVTSIAYDSRKVSPNSVFVAIEGFKANGTMFIEDAFRRGAKVIVCSSSEDGLLPSLPVTWIFVSDTRVALSKLSANFYGHPTRKLKVAGITGTAGKTTIAYLIYTIFNAGGVPSGLMGTIEVLIGSERLKSKLTTPESLDIHALADKMLSSGMKAMVMEVSSHSLKLHRVSDVDFDFAVFTNLGHDHLDFHGDINDYLKSKAILFSKILKAEEGRGAVVNGDDPASSKIISDYRGKVLRYGMSGNPNLDIYPEKYEVSLKGIEATIKSPWGRLCVSSPLIGYHNLMNIMGACGVALLAGIPIDLIEKGVASLKKVSGRMEVIQGKDGVIAIVDYSHTPDSLKSALESIAKMANGRIITVFGAGGDRDIQKRPLMGMAVAEKSTACILTSDNPRSEDPMSIIEMIRTGLERGGFKRADGSLSEGKYLIEPDRRKAIEIAVKNALPGDVILVAGKGHEDYQIFRDRVIHFDDKEELLSVMMRCGLIESGCK